MLTARPLRPARRPYMCPYMSLAPGKLGAPQTEGKCGGKENPCYEKRTPSMVREHILTASAGVTAQVPVEGGAHIQYKYIVKDTGGGLQAPVLKSPLPLPCAGNSPGY